jgi:DNA-binding GntR family transcriptional regulator
MSLASEVVTTLKQRIVSWTYLPGHRLTEEELCQEFGVSRSPVREALRSLSALGLIDKMPNRGYHVRQPDIQEVDELYEFRLALELYIVEQLARKGMPAADLEPLRQFWMEEINASGKSGYELAVIDQQFHEALASVLGNGVLLQQLRLIDERLLALRVMDFEVPERVRSTCRQHLSILDAIERGDVEGAREAMRANVEEGRVNVDSAISNALARGYMSQMMAAR